MVYFGGRIVVHDWCDILSVAAYEIFTCGMAPVCNRGQCVFLLCCSVRMHFGFVKKVCVMPYEYKEGNNKVWTKTRSKLPADLCCDGCDERS